MATGKREAAPSDTVTATMDGRIDTLFSFLARVTGRTLKYSALAVGAVVGILAIYLFSTWANSAIEEMPRNTAIIAGAIIIACAVASRR